MKQFTRDERVKLVFGIFFILFSLYLFLALISFLFTWKVDQSFGIFNLVLLKNDGGNNQYILYYQYCLMQVFKIFSTNSNYKLPLNRKLYIDSNWFGFNIVKRTNYSIQFGIMLLFICSPPSFKSDFLLHLTPCYEWL